MESCKTVIEYRTYKKQMRHLSQYLNEAQDHIGNDLNIGDMIQFRTESTSNSILVLGEITKIIDDEHSKFVVKTIGWFGDDTLRSKVKKQYNVSGDDSYVYKVTRM